MPLQNQISSILPDKHKQNHLSPADRESHNPENWQKYKMKKNKNEIILRTQLKPLSQHIKMKSIRIIIICFHLITSIFSPIVKLICDILTIVV